MAFVFQNGLHIVVGTVGRSSGGLRLCLYPSQNIRAILCAGLKCISAVIPAGPCKAIPFIPYPSKSRHSFPALPPSHSEGQHTKLVQHLSAEDNSLSPYPFPFDRFDPQDILFTTTCLRSSSHRSHPCNGRPIEITNRLRTHADFLHLR